MLRRKKKKKLVTKMPTKLKDDRGKLTKGTRKRKTEEGSKKCGALKQGSVERKQP